MKLFFYAEMYCWSIYFTKILQGGALNMAAVQWLKQKMKNEKIAVREYVGSHHPLHLVLGTGTNNQSVDDE